LVIHVIFKEKGRKREKIIFNYGGRYKSPRNSKKKCWDYVGHLRRDLKEHKKEKNDSDDESEKNSQEDNGYSFVKWLSKLMQVRVHE
jgi:hypothetical protein